MSSQNDLDYIKSKSIEEYHKDGNPNGEIMYNIVHNDFPTILDLMNKSKIKEYLIKRAEKIQDFDAIKSISSK